MAYIPKDIMRRFRDYFADHPTWGVLHIALDDGNLEDSHIQFCIEYAGEQGDAEGQALARILMDFTPAQRAKMYREASL